MISLDDVVLRRDLDPRMGELCDDKVARYAGIIGDLPPIEINQHEEMIDGWHRYVAARQTGWTHLPYFVTETAGDVDLAEKIWAANATFRVVYERHQRRAFAMLLHRMGLKAQEISRRCGVSQAQVYNWTKEQRRADKAERDWKVLALDAQGMTQQAIAEELNLGQTTVHKILTLNAKKRKTAHAHEILAKLEPEAKPAPVAIEAKKDKIRVNMHEKNIDQNIAPPATGQRQAEPKPTPSAVHGSPLKGRRPLIQEWTIRLGKLQVSLRWDS